MAVLIMFIWLVAAVVGWLVGKGKGRGVEGFVLGALLGLIGIVIVAVMKPARPSSKRLMADYRVAEEPYVGAACPACRAPAREGAPYCWQCGQNFVKTG